MTLIRRTSKVASSFLLGGGEMGARMRATDWSSTPLGSPDQWPQSLKTAVRIMLTSRQPMFVWWGEDLINLYNDAYKSIVGGKHPQALGQPASVVWQEIWEEVGPRARLAMQGQEGTYDEALLLIMERNGYPEETYYTFSYSPIPGDDGGTAGILCANTDDTHHIIDERQMAVLRDLAARTASVRTFRAACETSAAALQENPRDLPFALIYLLNETGDKLDLCGNTGFAGSSPAAPQSIRLDDPAAPWNPAEALRTQQLVQVNNLDRLGADLPRGGWDRAPGRAVIVPVGSSDQDGKRGVLIAGLNPFRLFDDHYHGFIDLVAGQITASIRNAQAYETERNRAEALAALDRAKTTFFSNVSHEFRTPLTLMLGPVEDLLDDRGDDPLSSHRHSLAVIHRNGQRLLKLVNTLLDFSRIEAGRVQAAFEPVDLARYTADLASAFRAAVEKAGMTLRVDCGPLTQPVYVDRDMWEKIVLNLVSNAFKYTLEGEIEVALKERNGYAELAVRDTGTGIPEAELPRIFERFHRIAEARGRTQEGTGIGLALVQELVMLHGGTVGVSSVHGAGSTFTVSLPLGSAHLPEAQIRAQRTLPSTAVGATAFVEEALRWLPGEEGDSQAPSRRPAGPRPRIVLADDNADMRGYVRSLLIDSYDIIDVVDGQQALEAAIREAPDLVLTDVMMPNLDGFALLTALRADSRTSAIPVIMLSARAGEEARLEGLGAGADDYLVKPFGARELLARVGAQVALARTRGEALKRERMLRAEAEALNQVARDISSDLDLQTVVQKVTDAATTLAGAKFGAFFYNVLDDKGESYVLYTLSGAPREAFERFGLPRNTAVFSPTFHGVGAVRMHDVTQDPRYGKNPPHHGMPAGHLPVRSYLAVPVKSRSGEVLGGLFFGHPEPGKFTEDHERVILAIASQAAIAIDNARLYQAAQTEIAERARIESVLRESEDRFRNVADNAPVLIWVNGLEGCEFVNREYLRFVGRPMEGVIGMRWAEQVHPDDLPGYIGSYQEALAKRVPFEAQCRFRNAEGEYRWIRSTGVPRFDGQAFLGYVGCSLDITEMKMSAEALKEADRRKDEFLATLAHELRNPLAPISNGLQVIKLSATISEPAEQARAMMERQLQQMVRLIDDLLDVSRISRGKIELRKERVDLAAVLRSAIETSRPLISQAGHELTIDLPGDPLYVEADVTRLSQVFANLLNNAAKYTVRPGHITVTVRKSGGTVSVSVKDDGIGIPPDRIADVFEMFAQVERPITAGQTGLGIGLTIVKRLVEMHGGSIEARSGGPDKGSEFVVRLPTTFSHRTIQAEDGESAGIPSGPGRRILVVDDNRDSALTLAMILKIMGHETRTAHDGLEAIAVAAEQRPEVIFLDIGMPKLNGYETCQRIRKEPWGKDIVMIALTGWGQAEDYRRSRDAGFNHHLVKPVKPPVLRQVLAELATGTR